MCKITQTNKNAKYVRNLKTQICARRKLETRSRFSQVLVLCLLYMALLRHPSLSCKWNETKTLISSSLMCMQSVYTCSIILNAVICMVAASVSTVMAGPGWSRAAVLSFYRLILRKNRTLEFTDKEYYVSRVKAEFRRNKSVESSEERIRLLEVYDFYMQGQRFCFFLNGAVLPTIFFKFSHENLRGTFWDFFK